VPSGGRHQPCSRLDIDVGAGTVLAVARTYDTVSFLSDYGSADEFAGVVRAVIRDLAPHVTVIDLTHEIPPHDVRAGSLALVRCVQYLPSGVVVAVVDPGVGTARRAVAVEIAGGEGVLVGPDNGLLAPATAMAGGAERAVELVDPAYHLPAPGATFAGRDVFAPVAAHLCNGVDLSDLGPAIDPAALLPQVVPVSREEAGELVAEILWVDRFGNAQLNVGPDELEGWGERVRLRFGDDVRAATLVTSFAGAGGSVGLVVDAYGLLAVCLDRRSAADELGLATGDEVRLGRLDRDEAAGGVTSAVPFPRSPR
jgi:S-adenosylmethionine hydrolase